MDLATQARAMARYNQWMNGQIFEASAGVADEDRKADRGAFFGSIHGTLNHLLLVDYLWMGRFVDEPYEYGSLDRELHAEYSELTDARVAMDERILQWANALTNEELAEPLRVVSVTRSAEFVFPLWVCVTHYFNHQTHHRGQVTTLLSQIGVDPGVTDLPFLSGLALDPSGA